MWRRDLRILNLESKAGIGGSLEAKSHLFFDLGVAPELWLQGRLLRRASRFLRNFDGKNLRILLHLGKPALLALHLL